MPRRVRIALIEPATVAEYVATLRVRCSKGTYVRTLAEDIARALGSCAHLTILRRLAVAPFDEAQMITLDTVLDAPGEVALLPPDAALLHLPELLLGGEAARRLALGQTVTGTGAAGQGLVRAYGPGRQFLGIGQADGPGKVKPVRIFNNLAAGAT